MVERVAILDAGSQYSKVIDRRVRELNVESEILGFDISVDELLNKGFKAIIISGGPDSVYSNSAPKYDTRLFDIGVPILGICYGMQLMNYVYGGKIEKKDHREDGTHTIQVDTTSLLFNNLEEKQTVLLTHGDSISTLGHGFRTIATSGQVVSGIENAVKQLYGLQFHPEVDLTTQGKQILQNFLYGVCGLHGVYTLEDREQQAIEYIRERVCGKKVLVLVSGGVDSAVCAALLAKAIGTERIYALHIDNGFMRKNESTRVEKALEVLGLHLRVVNAGLTFSRACTTIRGKHTAPLGETVLPEEKRKIIGDTFMRVAEEAIASWGLHADEVYLAQGTLRPDLIESSSNSVSSTADVIKTHHNDTELVRILREAGRVVEPLRDYHKDEVRELGKNLGLPDELVWRQPFPGPGLAIRILCADSAFVDGNFEETNAILHLLVTFGRYNQIEHKFSEPVDNIIDLTKAVKERVCLLVNHLGAEERLKRIKGIHATLVPIQTVGVQGDGRSYSYLAALSGETNWDDLFFLAKLIPKICHNINRIVYVFGSTVTGPIKNITPTRLTHEIVTLLQEADDAVNTILVKYNLIRRLSQVPVVLFPVTFGDTGASHSVAIRTFITNDFMTGVPAVPGIDIEMQCVEEMVSVVTNIKGIARVVYDLTSKPPGTTEWE